MYILIPYTCLASLLFWKQKTFVRWPGTGRTWWNWPRCPGPHCWPPWAGQLFPWSVLPGHSSRWVCATVRPPRPWPGPVWPAQPGTWNWPWQQRRPGALRGQPRDRGRLTQPLWTPAQIPLSRHYKQCAAVEKNCAEIVFFVLLFEMCCIRY